MQEELLKELLAQNKTHRQIGDELKMSPSNVIYWLNKYNLKTNYSKHLELLSTRTTKICTICKLSKELNNFQKMKNRNNIYYSSCNKCNAANIRILKQNLKQKCVDYKGGKCKICNYNKDITALDFHHLDPTQKDFSISKGKTKFTNLVQKELDKCILLCCRCHREVHSGTISLESNQL